MSRAPHSRLLVASTVLAAWAVAAPISVFAQAEDESFRQGLEARGDRRWAEAAKHMTAAIAINQQESTRRVRSGGIGGVFGGGTEYMPYYLLGEAYFEQGQCAAAIEAWAASEQQGIVRQKGDFLSNLQRGYKVCADKGILLPADFNAQLQATNQAYTEAAALAQRVFKAGNSNPEVWQGNFETRYGRGQAELQTAYAKLAEGTKSRLATDFQAARDAVVRGFAILRPLEVTFNATVTNIATVREQSQRVEQAMGEADTLGQAIDALKVGLPPALIASRNEALGRLAQARDRLGEARRSQSQTAATDAAGHVAAATTILTDVLEQARRIVRDTQARRLGEVTEVAKQAFSFVDTSIATLDRLSAERASALKPEIDEERAGLLKQSDALRRRLDRATAAGDVPGIERTIELATELIGRLDAIIKSFGEVTLRLRGVVEALETGARLFFEGEYQQALDALGPANGLTDVPLQLHVHLFRAAASYALFVRSGESQPQLRATALAEIERCRQIDPVFEPDPDFFSPRFIAFYREGAAAPQAAASAPSP
jgi:tetratricopeptide (TPR) repeat protein